MTIFSSFLAWSTPASLEAGQATKHAGAKTSAVEMQRRRVEQRGARMAVVCWDRPEKKGWEELWSNKKAKKPVLWAGWFKSQGFEGFYSSMVCSLWKFMCLQYTYSPLADCQVWFSSATKAESVAWAICALNARRFLTSFYVRHAGKKLMGREAHLMKL